MQLQAGGEWLKLVKEFDYRVVGGAHIIRRLFFFACVNAHQPINLTEWKLAHIYLHMGNNETHIN